MGQQDAEQDAEQDAQTGAQTDAQNWPELARSGTAAVCK